MSEPGGAAMERRAGEILQAQDAVRAILAPTGKDLEKLLIACHTESIRAQRKARRSRAKMRAELNRRLVQGETLVIHGNEVVVETVTNSDLIRQQEADANEIKVEAMAQRSYDVHRMIARDGTPQGGSIEEFIDRLEQEEATEAPDVEPPPDW
jgi:hypothetical protein